MAENERSSYCTGYPHASTEEMSVIGFGSAPGNKCMGTELNLTSGVVAELGTGGIQPYSRLSTPVGFFYDEDGQHPANSNTSRVGLMMAAEMLALPDDDVRKSVYHLVRSINRYGNSQEK